MAETKNSKEVTSGDSGPKVYLVAVVAANGIIGANNRMPWHLPEDLKHFKELTLGHPVIMGRKTWESILATLGKPLPGRESIVVSRQRGLELPGASMAASVEAAIAMCAGESVAFVIGGGELYAAALPYADGMVLTEIKRDYAGDTRFPDYDHGAFREAQRLPRVSATGLEFDLVRYDRVQ